MSNLNITSLQKSLKFKVIFTVLDGLQIRCLRIQSGTEINTQTRQWDLPHATQTDLKKGSCLSSLCCQCRGPFLPSLRQVSETTEPSCWKCQSLFRLHTSNLKCKFNCSNSHMWGVHVCTCVCAQGTEQLCGCF